MDDEERRVGDKPDADKASPDKNSRKGAAAPGKRKSRKKSPAKRRQTLSGSKADVAARQWANRSVRAPATSTKEQLKAEARRRGISVHDLIAVSKMAFWVRRWPRSSAVAQPMLRNVRLIRGSTCRDVFGT